jgi:hypothetical protein
MSDRAVQDEIIRYLADANLRAQPPRRPLIPAGEAAKAARFAYFLARRYYRDRLTRSFHYSHCFHRQTGRTAQEVVNGEDFAAFLSECVMGSLTSAERVAAMARACLGAGPHPGPWWPDLLDYESAYFLQAATSVRISNGARPAQGISAVCRRFAWALPEILPRLRVGEPITHDLQRECTLLFSRTHAGRIYVVEAEPPIERVFRATDGIRTLEEIADAAGVSTADTQQTLTLLATIGAVIDPVPAS